MIRNHFIRFGSIKFLGHTGLNLSKLHGDNSNHSLPCVREINEKIVGSAVLHGHPALKRAIYTRYETRPGVD